ncbi:MAG: hypothetical protein M1122_03105 [Candidatus Marsarchaeota archaeon]|nr:hypothetical protein [Candidatus Marsarchaeota archaeon]
MTKRNMVRVIGDHATFVKKETLYKMKITKKMEYLMLVMRIYIIAITLVIILSLLKII